MKTVVKYLLIYLGNEKFDHLANFEIKVSGITDKQVIRNEIQLMSEFPRFMRESRDEDY